jgi:hypothetical protein
MDVSKLTSLQRQIRMTIRNAFLRATYREMEFAMDNYPDRFSRDCLQEMMDEYDCPVCEHVGCRGGEHTYGKRCCATRP